MKGLAEGWTLLGQGVGKEVAYIWPTLGVWKGRLVLFGGNAWEAGVTTSEDGGVTWMSLRPDAPKRGYAAGAVLDDKLWIVGGQGHDDTWMSSDGAAWSQVATGAGWGGRWMHRVLAFDNRLYLIGGGGAPKGLQGDVWVLEGGDWRLVNAQAFSPRYMVAAAVLQDRMVLLGGHGETTAAGVPQKLLAEAQISADGGKTWTRHEAPWTPRWGAATAVVGDTLYLMGGYRDGATCGDVWSTRDGIAWTEVGDAPWAATDLGQFAAVGMGDHLVLAGGVSRDDGPGPSETGEKRNREVWAFKPPAA